MDKYLVAAHEPKESPSPKPTTATPFHHSCHATASPQQAENSAATAALRACKSRGAACLALIAFSGLRPQVLGNYDASNGLRLGDLPDLNIETLEFEQMPARINVSRELSKINKPFFTFLGHEGCTYVLVYLRKRRERGEALTAESPVIRPETGDSRFSLRNNSCDTIRVLCGPSTSHSASTFGVPILLIVS